MPEKQEGYNPPVAETEVEETELKPEQVTLPDIKDLDSLLEESEKVATVASLSEKEIDELVEKRQESLERLQNVDAIREQRLQRTEKFNPLKDLIPADYDRLVQEGMIDTDYAKRLKKLDAVIAKLESLDYPTADAVAELERLTQVRNSFRERIESQIEEKQQELSERRENIKNKVLEHYEKRAEELEEIIAEIESNPRVIERLHAMAEQERKEFEEKIEQERKKLLVEAARFIQSLSVRHANAFNRLGEITGNEKIAEDLLKALEEEDKRKQRSIFDKVRNSIIESIIDGEGKQQLKEPKEIVPWEVRSTSIPYIDAMDTLRYSGTTEALQVAADAGNEQAKHLLEQREKILGENEVLRKLVGRKWITDRKTGKKYLGAFWSAFETRKENDKNGITEKRKKEREEAARREAEFQKAAAEIIKRGGFVVEVPIFKQIKGKRQVIGKEKGVVRLEKAKSKKGNEYWKVVETFGATNGLDVGDASPLNMRSFPQWFRDSARIHFTLNGENFVERLGYETKE